MNMSKNLGSKILEGWRGVGSPLRPGLHFYIKVHEKLPFWLNCTKFLISLHCSVFYNYFSSTNYWHGTAISGSHPRWRRRVAMRSKRKSRCYVPVVHGKVTLDKISSIITHFHANESSITFNVFGGSWLTWTGTSLFVLLCLAQTDKSSVWTRYSLKTLEFTFAQSRTHWVDQWKLELMSLFWVSNSIS